MQLTNALTKSHALFCAESHTTELFYQQFKVLRVLHPLYVYVPHWLLLHRVFKQALQSAGGHLSVKHVEEVSLGVLFLMQAAKKTDTAFKVKAPSTTHTVRGSDNDVVKMATYLHENQVHLVKTERSSPGFVDPTESGWKKISTTTWLKDTLTQSLEVENLEPADNLQPDGEVDLYYELADASLV